MRRHEISPELNTAKHTAVKAVARPYARRGFSSYLAVRAYPDHNVVGLGIGQRELERSWLASSEYIRSVCVVTGLAGGHIEALSHMPDHLHISSGAHRELHGPINDGAVAHPLRG